MKKKYFIVLLLFFLKNFKATVEIQLEAAATAKAFDRASGTLYLGLDGGNEKAISKIDRYSGSGDIQLTGIATNATLNNASIEFLKISGSEGDTNPYLIIVKKSNLGPLKQTKIILATKDGQIIHELETDINDASGAAIIDGIVNIEVNNNYIFAAVKANAGPIFGTGSSGIALIEIDKVNNKLILKDATTGSDGNRALLFNGATDEIKEGGDVIFNAANTKNIQMHWDQNLQRLYLALDIAAGAGATDGGTSIGLVRIDTNKKLVIVPFVDTSLFTLNPSAFATQCIGVRRSNNTILTNKISSMQVSSGANYLVCNSEVGPAGGAAAPTNSFYVLPIINDPTNLTTHGTLASIVDTLDANFHFTTQPASAANLANIFTFQTRAGFTSLPVDATQSISDLIIIDDGIYISIENPLSATNESGILNLQALFDQLGRISFWTLWGKRTIPFDLFPIKNIGGPFTDKSRVKFFEIDVVNNTILAVDGIDNTTLSISSTNSTTPDESSNSLTNKLNTCLQDGCFSVLDLDHFTNQIVTNGLGHTAKGRYALFGGNNKVILTRISESQSAVIPFNFLFTFIPTFQFLTIPQTVFSDFSSPLNFLELPLPPNAGPVTTLEYSQRLSPAANQNYFFAGTTNGLYAFADSTNGSGFTVASTVNALNTAPFLNKSWQKVNGIEGQVLAIRTTGVGATGVNNGSLYILTLQLTTNPEIPLQSVIYRMRYHNSISNMEGNITRIAETGITSLSDIIFIFDMNIITIGGGEELLLGTNQGLYISTSGNMVAVNDQTAAGWTFIGNLSKSIVSKIFGVEGTTRSVIWPLSIPSIFDSSTFLSQITANLTTLLTTPNQFNYLNSEKDFPSIEFSNHFWTDGGRRFLLTQEKNSNGINNILPIPFNSTSWNITKEEPPILNNETLSNNKINFYHWIKQIGASGVLMAGTDKGIVAFK